MKRSRPSRCAAALLALCMSTAPARAVQGGAAGAQAATPAPATAPRPTWFVMQQWPGHLVKFDPRTDTVVATLDTGYGTTWGVDALHDRRRLAVITGQRSVVLVVDLETFEIVDEHVFLERDVITRVQDVREIPGGERWYVRVERVERKLDRYVVHEPEWIEYDLATQQTVDRFEELPRAIRRGARISPDGRTWHVLGKDLVVVDPVTLKEEGRIELSRPQYSGMGALSLRGEDLLEGRDPAASRFLYSMRDPVDTNRTMYGLVDLDLAGLRVARLTEWGVLPRSWGWEYAREAGVAIGARSVGDGMEGRGRNAEYRDPEMLLFTIDLATGRKLRETRLTVRNGLGLAAVAPDASKIYLAGRGHELVVHDAEHRYLKTIEMPGEITGGVLVVRP